MIPVAEPFFDEAERTYVNQALESGWVSSKGQFIEQFEQAFAAVCGRKHGIATSNGTTALHLALVALGIGEGDEVIVPSLTFVATAGAVKYTGARPVFVDCHPYYWCLDPAKIEERVNKRTRAIIPVDLYGHPCDMDPILAVARKHHLYVVEDAAEAHGAEYKGKKAGSFGEIACFSFFGNKIITTGEGGMCLTDDPVLAEKMRILRNQGMNPHRRYWHDVVGFNYRMTNIQAALGCAQLQKLERFLEKKRRIASWYRERLKGLEDKGVVKLHPEMDWASCVYWMYCILIKDASAGRDEVMQKMLAQGIETRPFFYPIHTMPPYRIRRRLPVTEDLAARGINLPSGVTLGEKEVSQVVSAIKQAAGEA